MLKVDEYVLDLIECCKLLKMHLNKLNVES